MIFWYNTLSRFQTGDDVLFLNHGLPTTDGDPKTVALADRDEKHRYAIQLYNYLACKTNWQQKDVLEVSCGRGGGADWLMRTLQPRTLVGLDIARKSTNFCRRYYTNPNLRFETGDAQDMPFENASFDIVINVESSLNYPNFNAYLAEVDRVLRPGGQFLIADYRRKGRVSYFRNGLEALGYTENFIEDISAQIIRGLKFSEVQKLSIIEKYIPRPLRGAIGRFARVTTDEDSEIELFRQGVKIYLAASLTKPF